MFFFLFVCLLQSYLCSPSSLLFVSFFFLYFTLVFLGMPQPVFITFVAWFRFFFFSQSRFLWWVVFFCFLGIWGPLLKTPSRLTFDKWPQANLEFYLGDNFCLIGKLFADEFTKSSRMCQFCVHQKREEISRSLFLNRTHLRSTPSFNITIFVYTGNVFWCFCIDMCYRGKKKNLSPGKEYQHGWGVVSTWNDHYQCSECNYWLWLFKNQYMLLYTVSLCCLKDRG